MSKNTPETGTASLHKLIGHCCDKPKRKTSGRLPCGFLLPILILLAGSFVQAQPVVSTGGVLNAASYALPGLQNSPIAQGAMFVAFGQQLGPAALQQARSLPLPTQLGGT